MVRESRVQRLEEAVFGISGLDEHDHSGETINPDAVNTERLDIGGTVYVEDENSPINTSGTSSYTYTMGTISDHVVIIPQFDDTGFDQMQVEGDTGSNYRFTDNADTETTGAAQWDIPRLGTRCTEFHLMGDRTSDIAWGAIRTRSGTGGAVYGENQSVSPPISQFTLIDSGSNNRAQKARVYRRSMNV